MTDFETSFGRLRVIVTGGRDYKDRHAVYRELDALCGKVCEKAPLGTVIVTVVHGGCKTGADSFADDWAVVNGAPVETYPADWNRWGWAAGPMRNGTMASKGADLCLAFPGGGGTADMVDKAKRYGIPVKEIAS